MQLFSFLWVAPKAVSRQRLASCRIVAVIAGCVWLIGIQISTVSAQSTGRPATTSHPAAVLTNANLLQPSDRDAPEYGNDALAIHRRRITPRAGKKSKGPRTKEERERERTELSDRTKREIDELYADYVSKLSDTRSGNIAVIYARYSTRFQDSIADQVRVLLEHALQLGMYVPRDFIFYDLAVRGYKKNRVGLNAAEATLRSKKPSTLLLFSTSRLFRKTYRTLEFVDQMHKGMGIRCIFVKSGVDTNDRMRWESILAMQSMIDEFVVRMYVDNIHAAHEGLLRKQIVFGTITFGYAGEEIDGEFTVLGRPRRRIVVDDEAAGIVRQIFQMFVTFRLPISEIARRLNCMTDVPLPPRASSGMWTSQAVRKVLTNNRYTGAWSYGVTESVYVPDGDYVRQRMRSEPLAAIQLDELRILPDELWFAAQARIAEQRGRGGRPSKDGDRRSRPKLLNGLLFCPGHEVPQQLYVSGSMGGTMHCPACVRLMAEDRALVSTVNRALATELVCNSIAEHVLADPKLLVAVFDICKVEAEMTAIPDPRRIDRLRANIKQHEISIEFTRRNVGQTAEEQAEAQKLILNLQRERTVLEAEHRQLTSSQARQPIVPTMEEVDDLFRHLAGELIAAATSDDEQETSRAREIVEIVTGGIIEVHQMGERARKKGWVQLRFRVSLVPYLAQLAIGQVPSTVTEPIELWVDVRRPSIPDSRLDQIWQLNKAGMLVKEIGKRLGIAKSTLSKLLKLAAKKHGEVYVDGRKRRATLRKKHIDPTLCERIEPEVMELYFHSILHMEDIGKRVGVCKDTITKIVRDWHMARGLSVPDGRTRRRELGGNRRNANHDDPQKVA